MNGYLDYAVFKLIPWKSACELMHKTSWELGSRMCVLCVWYEGDMVFRDQVKPNW